MQASETKNNNGGGLLAGLARVLLNPARTGLEQRMIESVFPGLACRRETARTVWCVWSAEARVARSLPVGRA